MERPYYVIDAFAAEPFTGNAAAVVLDAQRLKDRQMQAVAAEFNLSETTFILPPAGARTSGAHGTSHTVDPCVRFRWFTPTTEVDMCGHATLAGVHALHESGRLPLPEEADSVAVGIETKSGKLTGYLERIPGSDAGKMIWLDMIDPVLTPQAIAEADLSSALRLPGEAFDPSLPAMRTQDRDVLVFVKDFHGLNDARPDFGRLGELLNRRRLRGLCLATVNTLTPSINVQSRFFAPMAGVDEDPVTGSVHGPLAAYLVKHGVVPVNDGIAGLRCVQAKSGGRAGLLFALVQPKGDDVYAVRVGGQAITTMRGTLVV